MILQFSCSNTLHIKIRRVKFFRLMKNFKIINHIGKAKLHAARGRTNHFLHPNDILVLVKFVRPNSWPRDLLVGEHIQH
jgi:hypothetical protein